jgi:hypothetical protein
MGKNSAEYMRAYRARKKAERDGERIGPLMAPAGDLFVALAVIERLEEEVRYLKAELARKPAVLLHADRKTQQAERDRLLGKINRGG